MGEVDVGGGGGAVDVGTGTVGEGGIAGSEGVAGVIIPQPSHAESDVPVASHVCRPVEPFGQ